MIVNCRTNYKKEPEDVKNNNKNRARHASEPGSDKRTVPDSRSVSGSDALKVPDSRSVSGSAIDSFMIFLECYMVKMPDFVNVLFDGTVRSELA